VRHGAAARGAEAWPIKYVLRAIDKVRDGYAWIVGKLVRVAFLSILLTG
jgi:hypothetical protein